MDPTPPPEPIVPATPAEWSEIASRPSGVSMDGVTMIAAPDLEDRPAFQEMAERLDRSGDVLERYSPERITRLADELTAVLDENIATGHLDGLMVASRDGLVVAESHRMANGELLAAISTLFESVVARMRAEGVLRDIDELTIRGSHGEAVIVRYFPGLGHHYFLLGFAAGRTTYRRTMSQTLRRCGALLLSRLPGNSPAEPTQPKETP